MIATDRSGLILFVNVAAERCFGYGRGELVGQPIEILVPESLRGGHVEKRQAYSADPVGRVAGPGQGLLGLRKDGTQIAVEVGLGTVETEGGVMIVATVIDVSDRRAAENERERLIAELQEALAHIKTLKGLLPICASCKKIREDDGYWSQIEAYVVEHSEATFSHSICPECAQKLYRDF